MAGKLEIEVPELSEYDRMLINKVNRMVGTIPLHKENEVVVSSEKDSTIEHEKTSAFSLKSRIIKQKDKEKGIEK